MNILKKITILIFVLVLSFFSYYPFYSLYPLFFASARTGSIFIGYEAIAIVLVGIILSYIFFIPLLFTAFGGLKKYWWIGILLLPAAAFEVYFDWAHIYFPI
ncbi:MAG: hypothetical protein HY973_04545, partial [Candidatus Kerfeldbacteria bacterium]|nr:hypothetical protein [Candidatus Kerfeldbacteria bacterium]